MKHNIYKRIAMLLLTTLFSGMLWAQIPSGYYKNAEGKTGQALRTALHNIIKGHTVRGYSSLANYFGYTDMDANMQYIIDIYSNQHYTLDDQNGTVGKTEGLGWNKEHTWPQSWMAGSATSDIFHIYPTDARVNNMRSNHPYAVVKNATFTSTNGSKLGTSVTSGYTGTAFEPADEYKGDIARTYFYITTRYYTEDGSWGSSPMTNKCEILPWAMKMLLEWSDADPVSQKEIDRNNAVYNYVQFNRNPFIDHPEYARMIWDENYNGGGDNPGGEDTPGGDDNQGNGDFVKVTTAPADWSGTYLIVYEEGSVAFDGSLSKLDATSDIINVSISGQTVASATATDAAVFTIAKMEGGYSLRSASGKYIGRATDANGMDESDTPLANTITMDGSNVDIVGAGNAHLRFNASSGQQRFRYYKSSSYTAQKPIQLYRKTEQTTTGVAFTFPATAGSIRNIWYTLDGRVLSTQPQAKGIYIHNGKKYIIK